MSTEVAEKMDSYTYFTVFNERKPAMKTNGLVRFELHKKAPASGKVPGGPKYEGISGDVYENK